MSRPTIHCPACGRELFHLRRPQCLWCGARLPPNGFQQVAAPPGPEPCLFPALPPPSPITSSPWFGRGRQPFGVNPFRLVRRCGSPWEHRLRIAGAALFVCVLLARLVEMAVTLWRLHPLLRPVH